MGWKNKPQWFKLGVTFFLVVMLLIIGHALNLYSLLIDPVYEIVLRVISTVPMIQFIWPIMFFLLLVGTAGIYFIIGAIIGLIYGKIRGKKSSQTTNNTLQT